MMEEAALRRWTTHPRLILWIKEVVALCRPARVHLCDGSSQEYRFLCEELTAKGVFVPLNPLKHPGSFWCHSHPDDVARVEESTYICSRSEEEAGPTNNWKDPQKMLEILHGLFRGCMQGRTLYAIPFSMGPLSSPLSRIGVEITDSAYVVCNMHIMTRVGKAVLEMLGERAFVPCLHSVGVPLVGDEEGPSWPCSPHQRHIAHFPEERSIWSFGSGYGGNALLGKKCFALRIASVMAREEGWLAEHMLIMGVTNPQGEKKYIAAAFPSACGKTNLAMLNSSLPGWKVECVGDDIAWIRFGKDGRLYAINPEKGFFGVAPGTSFNTNPSAMQTIAKNTLFTNVALTKDRDVWWEGMTPAPPESLTDWLGEPWTPQLGTKAAHPNARFTVPASQCPVIDPAWEDPQGVPLSAILFGGRRSSTIPLVYEAIHWQHGVFLGATISSETTAAAKGEVGKVRRDPFAMLPFCGYHMGDYFAHWLAMGEKGNQDQLPRIFRVNWFRKSNEGRWLWPGYGENIRVLKWIFGRLSGEEEAQLTPIGYLPKEDGLDIEGMQISQASLKELFSIDQEAWLKEAEELNAYFSLFGEKLPIEIRKELVKLQAAFS